VKAGPKISSVTVTTTSSFYEPNFADLVGIALAVQNMGTTEPTKGLYEESFRFSGSS